MKRRERGQTLVEMAMVAPFLIMILLVMIDCGRAAYAYSTLAGASRDGARAAITTGSLRPNNGSVVGAVQQNAFGILLGAAPCINDAPLASPSMAPNTGLIYVGAGSGNTTTNAPGGQAPAAAAGSCGAVNPSYAGHRALAVTIKYNFQPLTPFGSQFFPGGIVMTVTSTMSTEY